MHVGDTLRVMHTVRVALNYLFFFVYAAIFIVNNEKNIMFKYK